jgi:hypothetical protein
MNDEMSETTTRLRAINRQLGLPTGDGWDVPILLEITLHRLLEYAREHGVSATGQVLTEALFAMEGERR